MLFFPPIVSGGTPVAASLDVPDIYARIAWRDNGFTFTDLDGTTGWTVDGSAISAAATLTATDSDSFGGGSCLDLVTGAGATSGVDYALSGTFTSGRTYRFRVALRNVSGSTSTDLILGEDLVTNGNFTSDLTGWTVTDATSSTWQADLGPAGVGDGCLRTIGDGVGYEQVYQNVSAVGGATYQMTWDAWQDAADAARSHIRWYDSGDNRIATEATVTPSGTSAWESLSRTVTAPATATYAQIWLNTNVGTDEARFDNVRLLDAGTSTKTVTSGWAWHTVDWTPSADRTSVYATVQNGAAATQTTRLDHWEVYEKSDEVTLQTLRVTRGSRFDGGAEQPGSVTMTILDPDDTYTPRNTGSALYGLVGPGRRVHVRAVRNGRLYALAYGVVTQVTPDPLSKTVTFIAKDGLGELDDASVERPFSSDLAYHEARAAALTDALAADQHDLATDSIESSCLIDGTDAAGSLLDYLQGLNQATGSVHFCKPHVEAVRPWRYTTLSRCTLTTRETGTVIDEDFQRLKDVSARDESLITQQRVSWVGYEPHPAQTVVQATASRPYWTFASEEYGSSEDPEAENIYRMKRERGKKRRRRRKLKRVGRRWVDAVVPIAIAEDETVTLTVDFKVPMQDLAVTTTDGGNVSASLTKEPAKLTIALTATGGSDTVSAIAVTGTPHVPLDEQEETSTASAATFTREGNPIDNETLPGGAAASGLADYYTWRWGEARLRPSVTDQHNLGRALTLDVGSHVTCSADRWYIDTDRFVVRSIEHDLSQKGMEWETTYGLEELPAGGVFLTLDAGADYGIVEGGAFLAAGFLPRAFLTDETVTLAH